MRRAPLGISWVENPYLSNAYFVVLLPDLAQYLDLSTRTLR
jgi:hypothetical protein